MKKDISMKKGDIVRETPTKKIVVLAADETAIVYEHLGKGAGGVEWHTGLIVIEKRK